MKLKDKIFRYRIITNLNCNMNESTGPNGNCYFCYQPNKEIKYLSYDYAIAIATQAEIKAGAACGQLSIITE